jgi:hypothetical protein
MPTPNYLVQCFVSYASCISSAMAGVSHGTYFAFYLSDSYLAIAIESRRRIDTPDGKTTFVDDQCKIFPLGSQAVFIAEGIMSNSDPRAPLFDIFPIALESYVEASPKNDLLNAADLWAAKMVRHISALYPIYKDLLDRRHGGEIVIGYFLGMDTDGKPAAVAAKVRHTTNSPIFFPGVSRLPNGYTMGGPIELVQEFLAGASERAKEAQRRIESEARGKSDAERRMIELKVLVEMIPTWIADPGSGGDIAQLIFEVQSPRWRWFHRPEFCPEN